MTVLILVGLAALCLWVFRGAKAAQPQAPIKHFEVREDNGLWRFQVAPGPPATPYTILAMIPAAVAAVAVTALWVLAGHDLAGAAWTFFLPLAILTPVFRVPIRARDRRIRRMPRNPSFVIGQGLVVLPDGGDLQIAGQYVVTRRNSVPYGMPAAYGHHVDIDYNGVSYTLAGGLADQPSMALYHEVNRRLRGEP